MKPSKDAQDTSEETKYEVRYNQFTPVGIGAVPRVSRKFTLKFTLDSLESAKGVYRDLRDSNSDLSKDVKPDLFSVEMYEVHISRTRMI